MMTIRFYCDSCEKDQPVTLEPVQTDALNDGPWGDVVCAECHLVLGTMFADEPGIYTIVRQDQLSAALARAEAAEAEAARLREALDMLYQEYSEIEFVPLQHCRICESELACGTDGLCCGCRDAVISERSKR
jgi:hypothetical protein